MPTSQYPATFNLASFPLRRKTASWFWVSNVQGAPNATPNVPILLSTSQGRNASGGTQCTLTATAYNYTTQVVLGSVTAVFTTAGTIKATIPASYAAPGPNYQPGQGVYVEILLSDASDVDTPAPQACYAALGLEDGS